MFTNVFTSDPQVEQVAHQSISYEQYYVVNMGEHGFRIDRTRYYTDGAMSLSEQFVSTRDDVGAILNSLVSTARSKPKAKRPYPIIWITSQGYTLFAYPDNARLVDCTRERLSIVTLLVHGDTKEPVWEVRRQNLDTGEVTYTNYTRHYRKGLCDLRNQLKAMACTVSRHEGDSTSHSYRSVHALA